MRYLMALLLVFSLGCTTAASTSSTTTADEIRALEQQWNEAIDRRDAAAMERFLAPDYALIIGVRGQPLRVVPRDVWLKSLPLYDIRSFSIDDFRVSVRGDVAVVTMLFTQDAVVGPERRDRSAQFMITDIWVRHAAGWLVAERHSSRPEPSAMESARVEQASDRFWAERDRADAAAFAAQFTEDGTLMIPGLPDAEGRGAIRELMEKRFAGTRATDFKVLRREIDVVGDSAWELGWFSEILRAQDSMRMSGRYLIVWKRGSDDLWRVHRYVYSFSGARPVA